MNRNNRALIFTGGSLPDLSDFPLFDTDFILAADSGYDVCEALGIRPQLLIGDLDSIRAKSLPDSLPRKIAPTHKDLTDTMLACEYCIEQGYSRLVIFGGLGGREDHSLSNIFFLENLKDRGVDACLRDDRNVIRVLKDETVILPRDGMRYFSLFALDSCTVTLSGCEYPLADYPLSRTNPFAVSNEITEESAGITVNGKVILAQSR